MEYRIVRRESYLEHHGILGMKWGVRRYQNPDGTLTAEGRVRYYGDSKWFKSEHAAKSVEAYKKHVAEVKAKLEAKRQAKKEEKARVAAEKKAAKEEAERQARERIATAKKYEELAKINPKYLTDQELRMMNERKRAEEEFTKNYRIAEKKGKEYAIEAADALVRQVLIPAAVGLGKGYVNRNLKQLQRSGKLPVEYAEVIKDEKKGNNQQNNQQNKNNRRNKKKSNNK